MFIAIDGPDGTGKTTLAKMLTEALKNRGQNALYTFEPTRSTIGMQIREIIKTSADPAVVLDLFLKDRAEHIQNFIIPTLFEGKTIVCDRYKLSTICYQETAENPMEKLIEKSKKFIDPDIYFVMYFKEKDVDLVCERILNRSSQNDIYDTKAWVEKTNRNFLQMKKYFKNLTYIDTNQTLESTLSQMLVAIEKHSKFATKKL